MTYVNRRSAAAARARARLGVLASVAGLALFAALTGCGDSPTPPDPGPAVAESLAVLSIDTPQVVGHSAAVRVRVMNRRGRAVADEVVEWTVINGTGSVSPLVSRTDDDGVAATTWTFGPLVAHHQLSAAVDGLQGAAIATTPRADSAAYVRLSTDSIHLATPGEVLRVTVSAADTFHNVVLRPPRWQSTDGTVAIVDESGEVHAVGFGSAEVHASLDGLADTARVIVAPHEGAHATLGYIRREGTYTNVIVAYDTVADRRHTIYERTGDKPFLLDWAPDGTRLVFAGTAPTPHLSVVDVPTRRVTRLTALPHELWSTRIAWSPDGNRIAYLTSSPMASGDLHVVRPDGSELIHIASSVIGMSWSAEGDLVYVQGSGVAAVQLWQLARDRLQPERIPADSLSIGTADAVRVSPGGNGILLFSEAGSVYVLDGSGGLLHTFEIEGRIIDAEWLPGDDIVIVQRSETSAAYNLLRVDADGSGLAPLTVQSFDLIDDISVNYDGGLVFVEGWFNLVVMQPGGSPHTLMSLDVLSPRWGH